MSKPIKMTKQMIAETMKDVEMRLYGLTLFDGKSSVDISYVYDTDEKATISFSDIAWKKQNRLVQDFSSEVGWHGICKRDPQNPLHFIVEDIIVFPQVVTGSTVTPSQAEYDVWNMTLPEDQFENCRYHGHSHVYMATSPSGTDINFQKDMVGRLEGVGLTKEAAAEMKAAMGDRAFYVFMIWNKRGDFNVRIYDLYYNTYFEGKDVIVEQNSPVDELSEFMKDAKDKVKTSTYTYKSNSNPVKGFAGGSSLPPARGSEDKKNPPKEDKKPNGNGKTDVLEDDDHFEYPYGFDSGYDWYDRFRQ